MGQKKKWLILGGVIALIILLIGGSMIKQKMDAEAKAEELRRNREYEVSLVNALKNSYEGIEEIKITNPHYVEKPGDWSCDIRIVFTDHFEINYRIGHYLDKDKNYNGRMYGNDNEAINEQWDKLYTYKGKTFETVIVQYSNGDKGEQ